MSGLRAALNNPNVPGESVLSFLFNAGDAGETFQAEILQYLNLHDAFNLRQANSRLNDVLKGRPKIVNRYNSRGNLAYRFPTNSILHALRAQCNGTRLKRNRTNVPCNVGRLEDTRIANVCYSF